MISNEYNKEFLVNNKLARKILLKIGVLNLKYRNPKCDMTNFKKGKAHRFSDRPAEVLKLVVDNDFDVLLNILNQIRITGDILKFGRYQTLLQEGAIKFLLLSKQEFGQFYELLQYQSFILFQLALLGLPLNINNACNNQGIEDTCNYSDWNCDSLLLFMAREAQLSVVDPEWLNGKFPFQLSNTKRTSIGIMSSVALLLSMLYRALPLTVWVGALAPMNLNSYPTTTLMKIRPSPRVLQDRTNYMGGEAWVYFLCLFSLPI